MACNKNTCKKVQIGYTVELADTDTEIVLIFQAKNNIENNNLNNRIYKLYRISYHNKINHYRKNLSR